MYCNNRNINRTHAYVYGFVNARLVDIMQKHNEGQPKKKRRPMICKWKEGGGCTKLLQHNSQGVCSFHNNIWSRRHDLSVVTRDSTATGGGDAPLINHGTVGWTDNCLPSGNGDNDLSVVARGNTATGSGGTPAINNELLSRTDKCLPSGNGDNDVSIVARGNTAMSQKKKRKQPICR